MTTITHGRKKITGMDEDVENVDPVDGMDVVVEDPGTFSMGM